jgi:methylglutaconyl-CoA hydratase
MSSSLVRSERSGGVATITLADEAHRNALGAQLMSELVEACEAADADQSVRVVVITNLGRVFCAGANLTEATANGGPAADQRHAAPNPAAVFGRFRSSPKPYVGRIAGHCVAGGVGLAAAMDIAIAADDVKFGFTEVRVGVAPAVISVVCLPKIRLVDAQAAMLRGRRFPAPEAAQIGLIHAAVPRIELDAQVGAVVEDLLLGGPEALAATKQLLARIPGMSERDAFAWASALSAELFAGAEAAEGMRAFLEKRPAAWVRPKGT